MKSLTGALLTVALFAGGSVSAAATTELPPPGPAVDVVITKVAHATVVTVKVGTKKPKKVRTKAATVADLLAQRKVTLAPNDVVKPALTTPITKKLKIVVKRVTVTSVTRTEAVAPPVVKKLNASLRRGLTKVLLPGAAGRAERTYTITTVNGKITRKLLVAETVLLAPVTKVIEVGTKGKALNLAHLKLWHRIAKCESGGRWHINTGNGYYGGLQFNLGTWRANGGRDFASKPHKATKAEQITVANRLYKKRGIRPWGGCA
jgi:resuscitation-promoting factor RpfB